MKRSKFSEAQIAFELGISPRTVEIYRAKMMEKLRARSLSEALRIALIAKGAIEANPVPPPALPSLILAEVFSVSSELKSRSCSNSPLKNANIRFATIFRRLI